MDFAFDAATALVKRQVNQSSDSNISSATQDTESKSASSILSTLVPVLLVAVVWLIVFVVARPKFGWKYSPRSSSRLLKKDNYTPPLHGGIFNWLPQLFSIPDSFVLQHQSLDSYLFLRFLRISVIICLVGCAITWPVLFPVNATGGNGQEQLNILTFANVASTWRWYAHALCAWLFFGFIMFMITRESIFYINLRQAFLMNPTYARKLPSRTVLYTTVPDDYLDETKMRDTLGSSVRRVWFPTNTKKLDDLVEERTKAALKLEAAETKLIRTANAARLKALKKGGDAAAPTTNGDAEEAHDSATADRWITPKERPTHRLKFLIGKKVDTIEWCRSEIARLSPLIDAEQTEHRSGKVKKLNSVFVEFESLGDAQAAYQSLTHHQLLTMAPRYTGMHPSEVIWSNLRLKGWERLIRATGSLIFVVALIIFWSIPVAVVGSISNIDSLIERFTWLEFLRQIPPKIFGVVSGLLPVVALALLMSLLPPFLRLLARIGGSPTQSDVEYTVSNYYFGFQVVQVFLVATLSSAASSAVNDIIKNPSSVASLLSTQLPKASNFYLCYAILQGLGVFAGVLVGIAGLFVTPLLARFLGTTPKKLFLRWNQLAALGFGTVFPVYTNLLVIAIAYSCVAPLVAGFTAIGLFLFYFAYRYNVLFVYDTNADTKGLLYPRALQQLFVGLYIAEICIIGLFATGLGKPGDQKKGALGPFILMILLLVFTALYHVSLNSALGPLLKYLPKTLDAEERRLALAEREAADKGKPLEPTESALTAPKHPKPGMIAKFLKPQVYNDYATMRRLVPEMVEEEGDVDGDIYHDAYMPPSVWNVVDRLVIPRDPAGMSATEVRESGKVVPITDAGATLDEKNRIIVDSDAMSELYFQQKDQRMKSGH